MPAKMFKKKRLKLPRVGAIRRMIAKRLGAVAAARFDREYRMGPEFPPRVREVTLARLHPKDRQTVLYYPDFKNFQVMIEPNRSLPVKKFFDLFNGLMPEKELKDAYDALTNYRLEFGTTAEDFVRVYSHETVHSCESSHDRVRMWAHPNNHLAIAALYPPGGTTLIARTIVNMEEKWYVKLYGDPMLVTMLQELGYRKFDKLRNPFKMFAFSTLITRYDGNYVELPFFDMKPVRIHHHPETLNLANGMFEVTVTP
jgi:hypothetical protein